jgi:beta-glucosidase
MSNERFPKDFYWGAATASYQVEGGIENNDWAEAAREGRVPECGLACNHYNCYEADFDIAQELGHTAHRFSLEWARIEPEEGVFDYKEIEHYRKVIVALKARGMEPVLTLWHFTLPLWFSRSGGFERKDAPQIFARYAQFVAEQLGDEVTNITTMNEPMVFAGLGWLKGNWPPFKMLGSAAKVEFTNSGDRSKARPKRSLWAMFAYRKVVKNLIKTHNLAYKTLKKVNPALNVSFVKHVVAYDSNGQWKNRLKAYVQDQFFNHTFLRKVYKNCDSIGLNFYHYVKYGDRPKYKKSDMGWEIAPEGTYHAIMTLWRYKKPIFISEAGIADEDDSDRAEYITKQVAATLRAIQDGVVVQGHLYWSLLDNYEWALGFEKRFGLVEVNYDTLERIIRPSAYVYKDIIQKNGVVE